MADNRKQHSSYGYTKTMIRDKAANMEGAIGLYMVLTGQAGHASVPTLARFNFPDTEERVRQARKAVGEL